MSSALKILPHYTYDDYVNWEGKWEIIDGIPYAMSPAPILKHQRIALSFSSIFWIALRNCKKCKAFQPIDYKVADDTILQPDLIVVYKDVFNKKYLDFPPTLVAEILSPSTAIKDRHTKFSIYEKEGVKYYLIISPDIEEVEVFELIDGVYSLLISGHSFTHNFNLDECEATIDFNEIWL